MNQVLEHLANRIRTDILLAVALCYMAGAAGAKYGDIPPATVKPAISALLVFFSLLFVFHRRKAALLLSLPLFILSGFLHTANALRPPDDPVHLYTLLSERAKVTLTGTVLNMPEYDGEYTRFDLAADSILFHEDLPGDARQQPAQGKIRLSLEGTLHSDVEPGSQIMALASANRTYSYRTPGVFDYRLYLAERGIHVTGKIQSAEHVIPFQDLNTRWHDRLGSLPERWRYRIDAFLRDRLDPGAAGIYRALLIGTRAGIGDASLEQFKSTGCMHLLVISGIHMSLLGLMITLFMTWLMKRSTWLLLHTHVPTAATVFALPPLILYAFVAGLNTPVLRSLLMSVLFLVGVVLQRQRSILFIVAAAALLLLTWKPLALFTVSFQLSFASILAIAVLYPRLREKFAHDGGRVGTYISSALLVSVTASLGALPFMLFHFNRFSLIGPLFNLLVEPVLCLWALPIGLLAIPLIFIAPPAAAFLLKIGSTGIIAAEWITMMGSRIPFASVWTITPSILEICIFYLLLLLWMMRETFPRKTLVLGTASSLLVLFFIHGIWFSFPARTAEVAYLDVGQGSSTFIRLPDGRTILVDAGSKTSPAFDIGERVIGPYLRKKRLWKIDDVIITHPHSDHANGVDFILRRLGPERLWINGDGKKEWPYRESLRLASRLNVKVIEPETGMTIEAGPGTRFTFLQGADSPRQGSSINDRSLVIRFDHHDNSFLFPGDISSNREKMLVGSGTFLEADMLLAPHHASSSSGSREFLDRVNPKAIIVSAGQNTKKSYLDPGHLTAWRRDGRTVLTTPESGTITCRSSRSGLTVRTFSGETVPVR